METGKMVEASGDVNEVQTMLRDGIRPNTHLNSIPPPLP